MKREWYLIDDDGIHPLDIDDDQGGQGAPEEAVDAPWPPFNQLVVDAAVDRVVEALNRTAPQLGIELVEVTEQPERWERAVVVAQRNTGPVALGEPGVELNERVLALEWSDQLVADLECDGMFFGYDPAAGTLHLTRYEEGSPRFGWADSLVPGPSYAMRFEDGKAVSEGDPRKFALRRMGLPETSPFLDRYRFVLAELRRLGLDEISPELDDLPVAAAMSVQVEQEAEERRG